MKKSLLMVTAFAVLSACTADPVDSVVPETTADGLITLEAGFDFEDGAETRTVRLADGKVQWLPGNRISLFRGAAGNGGSCMVTDITAPAAKAEFTGPAVDGSGYYYALYPYDPDSYYDGTYLVTTLPSLQQGVPGTFADNLFISVGRARRLSMGFDHLCGGIKFTLVDEDIHKVTLVATGGEALAGVVGIVYESSVPVVKATGDTESVLVMETEDGFFDPGEAYHFVTLPTTLSQGFSLIFERWDGSVAVRTVSKPVTIQRAHFATLLEADKGLVWEKEALEYSPDEVNAAALGDLFSIQVRAVGDYHVEVDPSCDWIIPKGVEGIPALGATHSFKVLRNTGDMRMAVVSVCNSNNCFPVLVFQEGGDGVKNIVHHSLGMRFTATWCGWCPYMNESFYKAQDRLGSRFEIVNLHSSDSDLAFAGTSALSSQYKVGGYPTGMVDGRIDIDNSTDTEYGADLVVQAVEQTEDIYPVVTSVGLSSTVSGRNVTVSADVYAILAEEYKLTVLLLENGIVSPQKLFYTNGSQTVVSDYVHDNIARVVVSASVSGDAFTAGAGETSHFTFPAVTLPEECNLANMTVLGYVQRKYGSQRVVRSGNYGDYYIDNCRIVPIGTSAAPEISD